MTPPATAGPPGTSAGSLLWKRLCQNGAGALRFGGTLPAFNQPAAPIKLLLITLQWLPQGDKARAVATAQVVTNRQDRQTRPPCALPSGPIVPLPQQSWMRGLSGGRELFLHASPHL